MKRTPLKRKTPMRQCRAQGPDIEREPKPSAFVMSTVAPLHRGVYAGTTTGPVRKEAAIHSEPYRRIVAAMPCKNCGASAPSQCAHPNTGKGMGMKTDDRRCFALCCMCHRRFDQGALFTKEVRRVLEDRWGAQTREQIEKAGLWPRNVPSWETRSDSC